MAVVSAENVRTASANADVIPGRISTTFIKTTENAAGAATVKLRAGGVVTGAVIYQTTLAANGETGEQVAIKSSGDKGLYVEITGSATVYLYTE